MMRVSSLILSSGQVRWRVESPKVISGGMLWAIINNLLMNRVLLVCLLIVGLSCSHLLQNFHQDITEIRQHHHAGDTSRVFSILMKLFVQTKMLYTDLGILEPNVGVATADSTCSYLLEELVSLFAVPHWVQIYQEIFPRLARLQQKCTNADFVSTTPNGFDDKCALCAVLSRVMENYIIYHRKDVAHFVEVEFCSMFDGLLKPTCEAFTHYAGPHLIKGFLNKENSDVICHGAGLCKDPKCKITDQRTDDEFSAAINKIFTGKASFNQNKPSPWKWLVDLFTDRFGDKHLPPFDLDNDTFSDISTFRGYHWRGSDCNEMNSKVYPGRKNGHRNDDDHDCNGIWGVDTKGKSLEEQMCNNYTRLGVAVIGDSAGAHFSIPEKFFNVTMMGNGSFHDLLPRIADELDLPYESAYTGHTITEYPSHSIYKHLRNWNLCNNNDFQNLGVNGGDSGNTWGNIKALRRSPKDDYPMLVFLELVGNDVCGSSLDGMTKPEQFKANIIRLLKWLDTTLPKGSHLVILGLADGDLLFEYLHGTIHPLDVPYDTVYDFLNCLKISPCAGWLNTNASAREYTTKQAKILSKVYTEILQESYQFDNFDIVYHDFPTEDMFKRMYLQGREPAEMIQRCDGFHPSGLFNSYLADWLWYKIVEDHPEWIGEQNPNNEQIKKLFGLKDLH